MNKSIDPAKPRRRRAMISTRARSRGGSAVTDQLDPKISLIAKLMLVVLSPGAPMASGQTPSKRCSER